MCSALSHRSAGAFAIVLMLVFGAAIARAGTTVTESIPLDGTPLTNPCGPVGTALFAKGTLHTVFHISDPVANTMAVKVGLSAHGTGLETLTGARFVSNDNSEFHMTSRVGGTTNETNTVNFNYQSKDGRSSARYRLHLTFHVTIANGVPTATVSNLKAECIEP